MHAARVEFAMARMSLGVWPGGPECAAEVGLTGKAQACGHLGDTQASVGRV